MGAARAACPRGARHRLPSTVVWGALGCSQRSRRDALAGRAVSAHADGAVAVCSPLRVTGLVRLESPSDPLDPCESELPPTSLSACVGCHIRKEPAVISVTSGTAQDNSAAPIGALVGRMEQCGTLYNLIYALQKHLTVFVLKGKHQK